MSDKGLSYTQLAAALEITRPTLAGYRKMPGAPKGTDLAEWQTWLAANKKNVLGSKELRDELRRHEIRLKKAQADAAERKAIPRDEVSKLLLNVATQQRSKLYQFLETEAPPKLDGLSAAEARPILREMADSICDTMAGLVEQFEQQ